MRVRSLSATERDSSACSSGTKMLTLPAEGLMVPTAATSKDKCVSAGRSERRARWRSSSRTRPSAACGGRPARRGNRSPSVVSAEPSRARVATRPTSKAPEPDRGQIDGQQHGDEAIAEIAQGPRPIDVADLAVASGDVRCCVHIDAWRSSPCQSPLTSHRMERRSGAELGRAKRLWHRGACRFPACGRYQAIPRDAIAGVPR